VDSPSAQEQEQDRLTGLSASGAATAIARGEFDSETLVRACLDRIAARDDEVGAWQVLAPEAALRQARARDRSAPRGPLHGVPVAVKDLIDTADLPTGYGSPIHAGHRPTADAECVARLRRAGAVVLGKTVTTEFAAFAPGRTVNPLDPRRTPGGSSSGSAAAVADGMVSVALGTQTAGSVVRPASFCGVFGLKPTYGAVLTAGVKPLSGSLDTVGWFARTPEDLELLRRVLADGPHAAAEAVRPRPRVGFVRTPQWSAAEVSTRERIEQGVERLAGAAHVEERALPAHFDDLVHAQTTIMEREAVAALDAEWRGHWADLSDELAALLERGRAVSDVEYERALLLADECRAHLAGVLAGLDFVLKPSAVGEAPLGRATGDPVFCRTWTLLGVPTVSVPGLTGPSGMPLGVQVVTGRGADGQAIAAAAWAAPRLPGRGSA
jgi:Asp-tRNA(Asn)/Glu-tRNA(Gln) amidotransferase A subunit family amidase